MADEVFVLLTSKAKIEREKGFRGFERMLNAADEDLVRDLEGRVERLLCDPAAEWESRHGGLMGAKAILASDSEGSMGTASPEFITFARDQAVRMLDDRESRVRLAAGEVMGTLCRCLGPDVYGNTKDLILDGVRSNLARQGLSEAGAAEQEEAKMLMEKLSSSPSSLSSSPGSLSRSSSIDAEQIFHDTAGWKNLETWMKCLQSMIDNCGPAFSNYIDQELLDLIFQALQHTNRFVRETGYYVCASIVACGLTDETEEMTDVSEDSDVFRYSQQFAEHLAEGLADNWSQVRLAASVAARKFLTNLPTEDFKEKFFPMLIPPLCLNRYYVAEGVRIYNQDTWRQVAGTDGRLLVQKYIKPVVEFYISQTEADNHAVREAACACIAELGSKIDKDAVRPFVPKLLEALLVCFNDESWPVRDASCVACGNFVFCFPEESKSSMSALYGLFFENLQDNIASVRQGAAQALSNVIKAYGDEAVTIVFEKVKTGLEGVEQQPANTEKYSGLEKGPATFGVVKKLRDNDMDLHTNKQMYSCGSLAPKMHKGKRDGGCMDHKFRRPPEPWELADGCINLLADISEIQSLSEQVSKELPRLATASSFRHYTQHVYFLETLCKQLPRIAKGIGKRLFKTHLELFFDPVFYSLSSDHALTSSASSQCLNQLCSFLGPNILKGRVEQYNPKYLEQLNANQFIAPL